MIPATRPETLSARGVVCADPHQGARGYRAEKPHQGVRTKKTAPHQGITWSNSTTALGLWGVARKKCSGEIYRARYYSPLLGRFINEDPLRFGAGVDFYVYTGDGPTNFSDPNGMDYSVQQSGDIILVTVPITFYGSMATPQTVNQWTGWIADNWNGHSWKGCHVHFFIPAHADPHHEWHWTALPQADNMVFVDPSYEYIRSYTWNGWLGRWWNMAGRTTLSHEFGHLLGLGDHYHMDIHGNYVDDTGWENDIMSDGAVVSDRDIDQVLAGRACACKK